jgi:hypothetical protein
VERKPKPHHLEPTFECDQKGLPRLTAGIKQPVEVHKKRKFLKSFTFHGQNLIHTEDPFVEFSPFPYILVYNYLEQNKNYLNIAQNFQHIIPNQGAAETPKHCRKALHPVPPQEFNIVLKKWCKCFKTKLFKLMLPTLNQNQNHGSIVD